ncbi:MAG: glycosyltransferase family 2 protein [Deltaproteobacteria bacterium]|nr:glycosyltransferase family 2 protein [Deltaproteobacteria bacterium]
MHLSIVIPSYNEEKRLGASLDRIRDFLASKAYEREVLVVNDGSKDATSEVARGCIDDFRKAGIDLRVIENPGNRGKGFSVKNGILQSRGEIALFTDADLSAPITEADKLVGPIERGDYDVVIASRALSGSVIPVHQSIIRETAGRTFNVLMRSIVGLPYKDTQCGFKAFRVDKSRPAFEKQVIEGFGFDAELLFLALRQGLRILEVPVEWSHVEGSKVGLLSDSTRMFTDLVKIRWNELKGVYK